MWGIPTKDDLEKTATTVQDSLLFEDPDLEDLEDDSSLEILHGNALYRKMQDVELVLRFFAYRQLADVEQGRLRDFLDAYLKEGNHYDVLGDRAFFLLRKKRNGQWVWYERPTKVLYDPMMFAFSSYIDKHTVLIEKSGVIKEGLERLYQEKADAFKGRSTNKEDILNRMNLIDDFLFSFVD
jgi:hypothetical protein